MIKNKTVTIISKYNSKKIESVVKSFGFEIVRKNPSFVLCYGGDGTVLLSERIFPGIPKIVIKRNSNICKRYEYTPNHLKKILESIVKGKYTIIEEIKLVAKSRGKNLIGLNEIQLHNKIPTRAIRFSLKINKRKIDNLLGDGIIVSTPFGSTAYYSSTGGRSFKKGMGISFNNLHRRKIKSFVVPENSKILIGINREPALIIADNNEKFIEVDKEDKILIQKSNERARFVYID